ncbi:MAG: carboxypeptidase regulatory-like domain-containing protein [Planctomycetes bacterium]|nr:carboxypeptidase regulatory-like domain-containing protein [Planctomycetota bacterium]
MRNSVYAGLCLGLLLTLGVSLGAYFYITAQNRNSNAVVEEEIADLPAQPTPAEAEQPHKPAPTIHFDEPAAKLDTAATATPTPETTPLPKAEVKLEAPKPEAVPAPADKLPLNERVAKLLRDKLAEGNAEVPAVLLQPVDPADLVDFSAKVSGTVVDNFGLPVAGAGVYADVAEKRTQGGGMTIAIGRTISIGSDDANKVATSDAQGNFTFTVSRKIPKDASVSVSITARAKGFAASEAVRKALNNGDEAAGIVVKLRVPGSVAGIVSTPEGQPIGGATVTLVKAGALSLGMEDSDDEIFADFGAVEIGEDGPMAFGPSHEKLSATTDAGGAFAIDNVPEGDYEVRVRAPGFKAAWENTAGKATPRKASVKAGQIAAADGPLHMLPTTSLRAVVRSTDGNAFSASVTAELYFHGGDKAGQLAKKMRATPDKEGVVVFGNLPAGEYEVVFKAYGFETTAKSVVALREGAVLEVGAVVLNKKAGDAPSEAEPVGPVYRIRAVAPDKR